MYVLAARPHKQYSDVRRGKLVAVLLSYQDLR